MVETASAFNPYYKKTDFYKNTKMSLAEVIKNASDSKELSEQRKIAKETAWMNIGNAGKNIVDFMIQKEESLSKKEGK